MVVLRSSELAATVVGTVAYAGRRFNERACSKIIRTSNNRN